MYIMYSDFIRRGGWLKPARWLKVSHSPEKNSRSYFSSHKYHRSSFMTVTFVTITWQISLSLLLSLFYICSILSDVWVKAVTRWRTCAANARESSVKMALLTLHVLRWPCRHVGAVRLLGHVSVFLSQCATCWSLVRIAIFKKSNNFLFFYLFW